ncbi:MAG: hypothetical protein JNM69_36320 [Archangium sp.]|nr:hypothetical protein [Archangium sp.]
MTFDEAVSAKKLRVSWSVDRPGDLPLDVVARVFELVCEKQPERPGLTQDEALVFESAARRDDGWHVSGRYVFDRDFASQYDVTETWRFEAVVAAEATLTMWTSANEP